MQPSESRRSKLTRVAARSAASASDVSRTTSVVSTTSIVAPRARARACRRPLPCRRCSSRLRRAPHAWGGVGRHDRERSVLATVDRQRRNALLDPVEHLARRPRRPVPMRPVEQTTMSPRPRHRAVRLRVRRSGACGLETEGPGEAVRPTGVEHGRLTTPSLHDLLRPQDRVGLGAVGGEDGGPDLLRAAIDHDGDIAPRRWTSGPRRRRPLRIRRGRSRSRATPFRGRPWSRGDPARC